MTYIAIVSKTFAAKFGCSRSWLLERDVTNVCFLPERLIATSRMINWSSKTTNRAIPYLLFCAGFLTERAVSEPSPALNLHDKRYCFPRFWGRTDPLTTHYKVYLWPELGSSWLRHFVGTEVKHRHASPTERGVFFMGVSRRTGTRSSVVLLRRETAHKQTVGLTETIQFCCFFFTRVAEQSHQRIKTGWTQHKKTEILEWLKKNKTTLSPSAF